MYLYKTLLLFHSLVGEFSTFLPNPNSSRFFFPEENSSRFFHHQKATYAYSGGLHGEAIAMRDAYDERQIFVAKNLEILRNKMFKRIHQFIIVKKNYRLLHFLSLEVGI